MTLTVNDVYQAIQAGDVSLAFDTSAMSRGGFIPLCERVTRINVKRDALGLPGKIKLCIPAVAYTERLFHMAQEYGDEYNIDVVHHTLSRFQIMVPDFTDLDAEYCAELLAQRYGTPAEWYAFKKRRCLECAGLSPRYYDEAKGTGQQCGAPNDWLIIAQASREGVLLVMDDEGRGGEYDLVARKARSIVVRDALERLLKELI